jgi:tetratricopeptide (TPR) repeat protein
VVAAARDDRIGAIVSLDGSVRSHPRFVNGSADALRDVTPERVAVPLLFIGARPKSVEQLSSDGAELSYSFLNSMKYSDVYLASMAPMLHRDFSSYALRLVPHDAAASWTREEVLTAYGWTLRYVHQFLDAYLKDSAAALAFLQQGASANGSPRNMMTLERRMASSKPATFERLAHELNTKGYDHAVELYKRMQKSDPKFQLAERSIDAWGYALFRAGRKKQAMEVFRLGVSAYPNSAALFESMGELYADQGDKKRAITYYRRSLELEPDNGNILRHLKKLGAAQ